MSRGICIYLDYYMIFPRRAVANVHVLGTGNTCQVIICMNRSGPGAASSDNVSEKLFKGEFKSSRQMRRRRRRPRKWLVRLYRKIPLK